MPTAPTPTIIKPDYLQIQTTLKHESLCKENCRPCTSNLNALIVEYQCHVLKSIGRMTMRHIWKYAIHSERSMRMTMIYGQAAFSLNLSTQVIRLRKPWSI